MLKGRIIKNISNSYTVKTLDESYVCTPRGKFRNLITPLVGDEVLIDEKNNYLLEIYARKNELDRPRVANIDYALLVTSLKEPNFSRFLLDKEITSVLLENISPIICFTKKDLLNEEEKKDIQKIKKYYESIHIPVFYNDETQKMIKFLKGKSVVLTGQSGAGKSTLLNTLSPSLHLKTDEISKSLHRGKHTTRHTEIFEIQGIFFYDTPGFSSLEMSAHTKEEIRDSFLEFQNAHCQFTNCMHIKEKGCEIIEKLEKGLILNSRYESYKKMIESVKNENIYIYSKDEKGKRNTHQRTW